MRSMAPVLLLCLSSAWGCGQPRAAVLPATYEQRASQEAKSGESVRALGNVAADAPGAPAAADAAKPPAQVAAIESMAASRKLIRTGQISIEVASYQKAAQEVTRLAESLGGYLADSRSSRSPNGKEQGVLTIRIPAERFAQSLSGLKGLGTVRSQNVNAQDVTKAYADLETRLRVKRDTAERLREILKTRTAALADVLQVERELARVTEEIEQMEGERRYYDQQVALSTLTVELQEPEAMVKAGSFRPIREALDDSLGILSASLAAIIYLTVFLTPWLLLLWVLWRVVKAIRARRRRAAAPPLAPPAAQ